MRIPVTILAVLLAFPAIAQDNKISIAGRAWGSVENVYTTNSPTTNVFPRYRVTNDSSFVRVRGDMKLSDDLAVFGQVEAQFAFDGASATPFDSGRNTGAGFTSKTFGTIMAGRWDSPMKLSTIRLDPWVQTGILNYSAILGQAPGSGGTQYDARLTNNVQYWSPVIQGVQFKAAVEVNEDRTSSATAANINPSVWSFSVTYEGGPLFLTAAYETRKDCFAGAQTQGAPACTGAFLGTHGRDSDLRLGAGYNYKPTHSEVGFVWERFYSFADVGANTVSMGRTAFYLSLVQGIGGDAHQFVGAYGQALGVSGNNPALGPTATLAQNEQTAAKYWTVAYRYNFNKDLYVYAGFVQIRNDDRATYRFGSSGLGGAAANPTGANYNGWVLGSRYLF